MARDASATLAGVNPPADAVSPGSIAINSLTVLIRASGSLAKARCTIVSIRFLKAVQVRLGRQVLHQHFADALALERHVPVSISNRMMPRA